MISKIRKIKISKKQIVIGSVILLLIGLVILYDQAFNKPTALNSYISRTIYGAPVNPAFVDDNLYECVVDAYNKKNKTTLPYTTNLTNEQLITISELVCSGRGKPEEEKISDASGIEKLINLTDLDLEINNLTTIDVSSNTALIDLNLKHNDLTTIDVSSNTALIELSLYNNNLTTIDVSSNTALTDLNFSGNNLTTIDVSLNIALIELGLANNNLTTIDVSSNTALTYLYLPSNNLTTIDVSSNTALTSLHLQGNNLTTIDVSKNAALTFLHISDNNLTAIDLSKNTELTDLYLSRNNLTILDVSSNIALRWLYLSDNNLTAIDLSKNTALTNLSLSGNSFNQNIPIYKGDAIDFKLYNNVVKLPSSLVNNYEGTTGVETTDGVATFNTSGQYNATSSYRQDPVGITLIPTYEITSNITVIEATSSVYNINSSNETIGTGHEINSKTILNNVSINYGTKEIINDKLVIKYDNEIVKEFKLLNYNFDASVIINGRMLILENTIEEFLGNPGLKINGYAYGVHDGANLLTTGSFGDNYTFRIMNGDTIVEEYELHYPVTSLNLQTGSLLLNTSDNTTGQIVASVTPSYALNKNITMSSSNEAVATVNSTGLVTAVSEGTAVITLTTEDGNFTKTVNVNVTNIENLDEVVDKINKIPLGTDVGNLDLNLPASVTAIITDSKGNEKTSGKIGTGDTIEIIQSSGSTISVIYESVIVIKGDVTGDGISTVSDVAKLYQYYKEKITMDNPYITAGSVVDTDNIIKIGDIAKLYQYIKGKISSL